MNIESRVLAIAMLLFLMIPVITTITPESINLESVDVDKTLAYTTSGPIEIHNNTHLESLGFPGSGTESEPYLIEGLNITSDSVCIDIANTTKFVSIINCYLSSATAIGNSAIHAKNCSNLKFESISLNVKTHGIWLDSCTSCQIHNCSANDCDVGFAFSRSTSCFIGESYAYSCTTGIVIIQANDCTADGCTIQESVNGVHNTMSENSIIMNNEISDSSGYGIYEYRSLHSIISFNSVHDTTNGAIRLEFSNYTTIQNNELVNQGWDGIRLCYGATDQTVRNNIIHNSGWNGICSENPNSLIKNNTISHTTWYGIRLNGGPENIVQNNHVSFSSENGIGVENSESALIENNTVLNSTWHGIATSSWNSTINYNKVYNSTSVGITTYQTSDTIIEFNHVEDTQAYGLSTSMSPNADISNNILVRTGGMVAEFGSDYSHLNGNKLYDTFWTGMRAHESQFCVFESNEIYNTDEDGVLIHAWSNNTIVKNNIFDKTGWQGLSVFNASSCQFINNEVQLVDDNGILVLEAPNTTVSENIFFDVGWDGIYLDTSKGSKIIRNQFSISDHYGVEIANTEDITVHGNLINNSHVYDISLESASNCLIYFNAFLTGGNHGADISLSSNLEWDNTTIGNYWEQYDGVDEDDDGIGDTPYEINSNNIDHYPIVDFSLFDYFQQEESSVSISSMTTSPESPTATDVVTVSVTVDDPDSVKEVIVSYSVDQGLSWTNTSAVKTGDHWEAEIPAQLGGSLVYYKAYVCDNEDNWVVSSTDSYQVQDQGLLNLLNPALIIPVTIGVALLIAGYMVYRGRKRRSYDMYFEE